MFTQPRLVFNFIQLTGQNGMPLFLLADMVAAMQLTEALVDIKDPETGEIVEKGKRVPMVIIHTPFGQQYPVYDKVDSIAEQLAASSTDAIKTLQRTMSQQVLVPGR